MLARTARILKLVAQLIAVSALTFLAVRTFDAYQSAPLAPWHTFVPNEMAAEELDEADWDAYLAREQRLFDEVRAEVTEKLAPQERIPSNRYFEGSPLYPGRFVRDWNRSYVLEPEGEPRGAVVLLHGLTDSPYSLRHIGRHYSESGYVVIGIRLPGHGTVPAGLTNVQWKDWSAATRLAVREAVRRIGPSAPLQLVGFSNGGALALKYALDAVEDPSLRQADRVILITPMIGITEMARFAGFAGLPAIFPAFASAAWLGVIPEFNPFKYNSFPVNGARQSSLLTRALQPRIARHARDGRLDALPPIITFQSVVDFTVSTRAIVTSLYAQLPQNGSELVLFDINRNTKFGPLIRPGTETALERLLPPTPRAFKTTVIANAGPDSSEVVERVIDAGEIQERTSALGLTYPREVFSLSHVALPFPIDDSLYGLEPNEDEDFGAHLGALAIRGERGVLVMSLDSLVRLSWNPFFPYLLERIEEGIVDAPLGGDGPRVRADAAISAEAM
ncbi:alpha/beta hydrolase [Thiocapsa rosea]|uniref:Alpha-beta hydrolase superfamily lysophospholipase n=1 Tax=Thiocapsa rosea TaxID=69360 RepID=A0A495V468_9GAMM|nr:alpha/beta hydrolase [Thiocapsa rosea]RKT44192.1 alpha-beta hydrolase superfamily lysophospholipase [Thiocapsa rosea]